MALTPLLLLGNVTPEVLADGLAATQQMTERMKQAAQEKFNMMEKNNAINSEECKKRVGECVRKHLIHNKKYVSNPEEELARQSKLSRYVWKQVLPNIEELKDIRWQNFEVPQDTYNQYHKLVSEAILKQLMTKRSTIVSVMKASIIRLLHKGTTQNRGIHWINRSGSCLTTLDFTCC